MEEMKPSLYAEVNESVVKHLEFTGSAIQAAAMLGGVISCLYFSLQSHHPESAVLFREAMGGVVRPDSPVWEKGWCNAPGNVTMFPGVSSDIVQ